MASTTGPLPPNKTGGDYHGRHVWIAGSVVSAPSVDQPVSPLKPTDKLLLTVTEVAELLSLSTSTIENLTASGELPSVKIGKCRRYYVTALQKWAANLAAEQA